jgi:hypothetical protein
MIIIIIIITLYIFLSSLSSGGRGSFPLFSFWLGLSSYASGKKERRVGESSVQPRVFYLPLTTQSARVLFVHQTTLSKRKFFRVLKLSRLFEATALASSVSVRDEKFAFGCTRPAFDGMHGGRRGRHQDRSQPTQLADRGNHRSGVAVEPGEDHQQSDGVSRQGSGVGADPANRGPAWIEGR